MTVLLIIVLVALLALVVRSLVLGIKAFKDSHEEGADQGDGTGPTAYQLKQNKYMWARIKFQLAAIAVVALLGALAHHH